MKLLSKFKKLKRTKYVLIGMVAVSLITGITVSANIGSGRKGSIRVQEDDTLDTKYQETVVETPKENTKEEVEETDFETETETSLDESGQELAKEDIKKQELIEKKTPVPDNKLKEKDAGGISSNVQSNTPIYSIENQNQNHNDEQANDNPPSVDQSAVVSEANKKVGGFLTYDSSKMHVFYHGVPATYSSSQMVEELVGQYRAYQQYHGAEYFRIESGGQDNGNYIFTCYYGS